MHLFQFFVCCLPVASLTPTHVNPRHIHRQLSVLNFTGERVRLPQAETASSATSSCFRGLPGASQDWIGVSTSSWGHPGWTAQCRTAPSGTIKGSSGRRIPSTSRSILRMSPAMQLLCWSPAPSSWSRQTSVPEKTYKRTIGICILICDTRDSKTMMRAQ